MVICDHIKWIIYADARWPGSTSDTGAVSRSRFLRNLFVRRDDVLFPLPSTVSSNGGFHKRSCFFAPDLPAANYVDPTKDFTKKRVLLRPISQQQITWRTLSTLA